MNQQLKLMEIIKNKHLTDVKIIVELQQMRKRLFKEVDYISMRTVRGGEAPSLVCSAAQCYRSSGPGDGAQVGGGFLAHFQKLLGAIGLSLPFPSRFRRAKARFQVSTAQKSGAPLPQSSPTD